MDDIFENKELEQTIVIATPEDAHRAGMEVPGLIEGFVLAYKVFYSNHDPKRNPGQFMLLNGELSDPSLFQYSRSVVGERAGKLKDYARKVLEDPQAVRADDANAWMSDALCKRLGEYLR